VGEEPLPPAVLADSFLRHFLLLLVLLTACTQRTPTSPPALTATTAAGATATASLLAASPTPPDSPTPTAIPPTPTATPTPAIVGYITTGAGSPGARPAVEAAAAAHGWVVIAADEPTGDGLRGLAAGGASVIVADGPEFEAVAREIAAAQPEVYVIVVQAAGAADGPANLLRLGGPLSREDQLGFAAGVVAGHLTRGNILSAVANPTTATGLKYRNGFLHGVRYACSRCRVDFIDLADETATAFAAERAALNASLSSDVVFGAAGAAGEAGIQAAAARGAWVLGVGADVFERAFGDGTAAGAERMVTSAYFDVGAALRAALDGYAAGAPPTGSQPLSAANGAVALAPFRVSDEVLSELDRREIEAVISRLADGSLETGVDPLTGAEL
jgi:basic membrane protein A